MKIKVVRESDNESGEDEAFFFEEHHQRDRAPFHKVIERLKNGTWKVEEKKNCWVLGQLE